MIDCALNVNDVVQILQSEIEARLSKADDKFDFRSIVDGMEITIQVDKYKGMLGQGDSTRTLATAKASCTPWVEDFDRCMPEAVPCSCVVVAKDDFEFPRLGVAIKRRGGEVEAQYDPDLNTTALVTLSQSSYLRHTTVTWQFTFAIL